ncbi:hemolysin family protein [Naumannella halotolerans]|uniref:Putative hemolysin n=1 Tax=Naumannella halotolerans TaxID=993414 RepID=A0A4R7J1Q4_9ACTN|nr:hemolysin family protein [Naumannella halotolerans]TDT30945.1 putative hemolysin [Naumannella halotolerans]
MIDWGTLADFGLVLLFVLIGGVFAATELALVSLRESQIRSIEDSPRGAKVATLARDPNRFLAAVQIGVTVAGFFSAAFGAATIAPDISPYFVRWGIPEAAAGTLATVIMTLIIAYLSLVLGELVPKRIALQRSTGVAMAVGPALSRFAVLMRPAIWVLSVSTNALVRLLGGDPNAHTEEVSDEELRDIVSSHEGLSADERQMLDDVFEARERSLREVMRPRHEVAFLAADQPLEEAAAEVEELPYSRYPITGENFDDVIGFLHIRDLIGRRATNSRVVGDVARNILSLPNSNRVLPTVELMREKRVHMAVVIDEYGGTDGIVTLEDLLEEIVGEIADEYDTEEKVHEVGSTTISAGLSIEDFAQETGVELPDGDYETVAGYVISQLGRLAEVGDQVGTPSGAMLTVNEVDGHRISEVTVSTPEPPATEAEPAD